MSTSIDKMIIEANMRYIDDKTVALKGGKS